MTSLKTIVNAAFWPLKEAVRESDRLIATPTPSGENMFMTAIMFNLRLKMAVAPVVVTAALYGAAGYGVIKGTTAVYHEVKQEVAYQKALSEVRSWKITNYNQY